MVHQEYSKNYVSNTVTKIQDLVHSFEAGNQSPKPAIIDAYEGLYRDTSKARLAIESKLQSRYVGKVPWSPELQIYRDRIDFWSRIVKLMKGVDTSQTELKRLSRKLQINLAFHADLPSAVLQLMLAYRSYREAKVQAPDWRDEHNQSLIDAYIAEGKLRN